MRLVAFRWEIVAAALAMTVSAQSSERLAPGASSCTSCHASASSDIAAFEGLTAAEIEAALGAYRSGAQGGTIMPRIAKGFSPEEAHAIAASLGRDRRAAP